MPTNDPHPTARALVEAQEYLDSTDGRCWRCRNCRGFIGDAQFACVHEVAMLRTAARDAGRREGREEMRERAAKIAERFGPERARQSHGFRAPCDTEQNIADRKQGECAASAGIADAIRQLPLDDAAWGEEPS